MGTTARSLRATGLLYAAIASVTCIDFIQNGMLNFASAYVMGGVGAAPEEYSLIFLAYATAAILALCLHAWMVERIGYRSLVQGSLLVFALGTFVCGAAEGLATLVAGRAIQGLGGGAFFTAGRLLVNRKRGFGKYMVLLFFGYVLVGGNTLGPMGGAWILTHASWRWLFWSLIPFLVLPAVLSGLAFKKDAGATDDPSRFHPAALAMLVISVLSIQMAFQKAPYVFFGRPEVLAVCLAVAALAAVLFILKHHWTSPPDARWRSFVSGRYFIGLALYFVCYTVLAANSFILPLFVQQGLGFDVPTSGLLLAVTFIASMGVAPLYVGFFFKVMSRLGSDPALILASIALACFGYSMHGLSSESTFGQVAVRLCLNGFFLVFFIATVAMDTFKSVASDAFAHAYQSKNVARQLALSFAVSSSTVFIQWRSAVHAQRLGEHFSLYNPLFQQALTGLQARLPADPRLPHLLLGRTLARQSVLMSCLDFYWVLCVAGGVLAALFLARMLWTRPWRQV